MTPRHKHSYNERLQKLRKLSDDQLQALSDDEFWDAVEPEGVCPKCDPRIAEEARRRGGKTLPEQGLATKH